MTFQKICTDLFLILIVPIILSSCMKLGPDFTRPQATLSQNWQESGDGRLKTDPDELRDWWLVFEDATLDGLIEKAYRENLSLKVAGVRVLEARAQLGIAVGGWYPQSQQASGSLQTTRTSARSPNAIGSSELGFSQSQISLSAAWELDFWGKFRRAIESADASLLAAIADYDSTLVSLTADVSDFYTLIRILEKRLEIARQNVETQRESLILAEAKFRGGTTTERDYFQAKTVLANTQATIPTLESQLRQAKNALGVLLAMPPGNMDDLLSGSSGIPVPPLQVAVGAPAELLRRRPDIRSAEMQAAAQCAKIGAAKADLLPAFSLTGSFGFLSSDLGQFSLGDIFMWKSRTGSIGPAVQWNILNYGRITNQVRLQDARFQELLLGWQNLVIKAQQEVEDSMVSFLRAQERARFLGESTESARRSLDLAVLQYREGTTDFTTVLTAQQSLLSEQDNLATTLGDIARSLVGVYRALGGGWQMREGQEFVPPEIKEAMAKRTNWGKLLATSAPLPPAPGPRSVVRPPDW